nr:uncharacterized protein LOC109181645 [Ipomoea batatas]GME09090.1 uncharacterized protein LOC109181645 [Ipomoea batatas]
MIGNGFLKFAQDIPSVIDAFDQQWRTKQFLDLCYYDCSAENRNRAAESQLSLKAFHTSTCPCMKKNSVLHKENCHLSATVISPEHNGDVFPGTFDHVDWKCTLLIFSHLLYGV